MLFTVTDYMGDDTTVVNAARVSMGKRVDSISDRDVKLIRYLAQHKHVSPFYHPKMAARVKAPIFVVRQWFRHRVGIDYNEISGRYVEFDLDYWAPDAWRLAAPSVKQGSSDEVLEGSKSAAARHIYDGACIHAFRAYADLLSLGVCREQARAVLPLATFTEFVVTGSLMAWFNFYRQRADDHAQAEIRVYADAVDGAMMERFPHSWQALKEFV